MKLFRQILSQITENADVGLSPIFTVVVGQGAYFQNVKGISRFSAGEIILSCAKGEIKLSGQELCIEKYSEGDVLVRGKIVKVEQIL